MNDYRPQGYRNRLTVRQPVIVLVVLESGDSRSWPGGLTPGPFLRSQETGGQDRRRYGKWYSRNYDSSVPAAVSGCRGVGPTGPGATRSDLSQPERGRLDGPRLHLQIRRKDGRSAAALHHAGNA